MLNYSHATTTTLYSNHERSETAFTSSSSSFCLCIKQSLLCWVNYIFHFRQKNFKIYLTIHIKCIDMVMGSGNYSRCSSSSHPSTHKICAQHKPFPQISSFSQAVSSPFQPFSYVLTNLQKEKIWAPMTQI